MIVLIQFNVNETNVSRVCKVSKRWCLLLSVLCSLFMDLVLLHKEPHNASQQDLWHLVALSH